jgi:hypothetical protein
MGQCAFRIKHEYHPEEDNSDKLRFKQMSGMVASPMGQIIGLLKTKQMRRTLAEKMNEAIDIPMIGEQTEAKIFKKIIKLVVQALEDMLEPDSEDE